MANLSIENLSGIIESGNVDNFFEKRKVLTKSKEESATDQSLVTFSEMLNKSVSHVNQLQNEADLSIKELLAGRNKNIHETMLAVEKADLSLKLMVQVRNKILEAYREIMRMQV